MGGYTYPVDEDTTEPSEHAQDSRKRKSELSLLELEAGYDWSSALDFGCGRGNNLIPLHRAGILQGRSILGVDPDTLRAAEAARQIETAGLSDTIEVRNGGLEYVSLLDRKFDLVQICQVIGHTAREATESILRGVEGMLAGNGRMLIFYPVVTPAATDLIDAPISEDFFHLVNFEYAPFDRRFRKRVSASTFDEQAVVPDPGLLPVRCFFVDIQTAIAGESLSVEVPTPTGISQLLPAAKCRTVIYSSHLACQKGVIAVGDALTVVYI